MVARVPIVRLASRMTDTELYRESHMRSLLKGLTWRAVATATTVTIAWLVTGEATLALKIGAIEVVAKILIYYAHERAWQMVPPGAVRKRLGTEA